MAQIAKKTKRYHSDLTDEEWARLGPLMPKPGRRGRPREVIHAVRYLVRSGCGWRMLPIYFGAWQTVYGWFRKLARRFLFQIIHDIELMLDRERQGREGSPSAAVIDSQSVKATSAEKRGFDAGKKVVGRKRHIAVDTDADYYGHFGQRGCPDHLRWHPQTQASSPKVPMIASSSWTRQAIWISLSRSFDAAISSRA